MKVAIAGYGIEGKQNYEYFAAQGHDITIVDERTDIVSPVGAALQCGPHAYDDMSRFDMVVRTAGLSPHKLTTARRIWSATNEFFAQCPAPIIGVTGTKGKGTTSSFIASILRAAGKTVHLVGNIGIPALQVLPQIKADDVVVYEMSSFQLWDVQKSPQVAVVLMIEPDHLEVHADFDEYVQAKANIRRYQQAGDVCVYHPTNPHSAAIASATEVGVLCRYGVQDDGGAYEKDGFIWLADEKLCPTTTITLPGTHNVDNACAAITAVRALLPVSTEVIAQGLAAFTGLPHRLKYVATVNKVAFYDDSIATTPGSAIAAVRAFSQPKVLILGGSYKGADFTALAKEVAQQTMRHIVLIGAEAVRIAEALRAAGIHDDVYTVMGEAGTMAQAVTHAAANAQPGDVVILSPACASFGMFKNYQDRGEQFIAAVQSLAEGEQ